jgi:predicted nucleotidyltransferase component of viral defense system
MTVTRQRRLTLIIVEKDYALGWALFGLSDIPGIVLKGGTALSKIHHSQSWRLSEDLDFSTDRNDWETLGDQIWSALDSASKTSHIGFTRRSVHSNPQYLQLRIQYDAILMRNTLRVDITREPTIGGIERLPVHRAYSDYPDYSVNVQGREEILAEKLRTLIQRTKVRDYYDAWRLMKQGVNETKARELFLKKIHFSQVQWMNVEDFFPEDLEDRSMGYWEVELSRLVQPVPEMHAVLSELRNQLHWLRQ